MTPAKRRFKSNIGALGSRAQTDAINERAHTSGPSVALEQLRQWLARQRIGSSMASVAHVAPERRAYGPCSDILGLAVPARGRRSKGLLDQRNDVIG